MKNQIINLLKFVTKITLSSDIESVTRKVKMKLLAIIIAGTLNLVSDKAIAVYCPSTPSCGNAEITSVSLNGTTNNSAGGAGAYTLFTSPTFSLSPTQTYTLTVTGSIGFAGNYHLNAWIDYDGSVDFNGVISEKIEFTTVSYALGSFTKSTTFTVPATAASGNSRLRLQLRFVGPVFGAANPCQTNFCGEVEDYPLSIVPLPPICSSSSNNSSNIYISRTDVNGTTTFSGASTYSSFLPGITLFPKTNYTLSVDITNPTATAQSVYVYGWLEVNGDNVFSANANEQIVVTPIAVTIPAFATQSFSKVFFYSPPYAIQATRFRITAALASGGVPTPCATNFTGEVEDYTVLLPTDYCDNAGTSNSHYITNVSLNGVSNSSGASLYSDFTNLIIPLGPGQNYPISVVTAGGATLTSVYIDFNQNGYFQDPGEQVSLAGSGTFTGNIAVPALATVGNTRMRVVTLFTVGGGNALPCNLNGVSGEVEDYTVMIVSPVPPTINCGQDIVVTQDVGNCSKQVLYSLPVCATNCNGGIITLTSGLPSGSNFPVGTTPVVYTVTTPGGSASCTFNVKVNLNPLPVFSPSGTQTICSGNTAILTINTYASYLWSNGATTQGISTGTAGNYTVTVTTSIGCTSSVSQSVIVNSIPIPTISGVTTFCSGNSTTLNASGGFNSYTWSTGATTQSISVNTAGAFTVTVTNANGCSGSSSVTTTINPLPTPTISGATAFCAGSSTALDAGSYSGYNWSTGETTQTVSVNTSGTITVTVTDGNGCSGDASVTTTINPLPTPLISSATAFCAGSSTTLDAGAYAGYTWSTGETTQTVSVNTSGTITVTVTNGNGCSGNTSVTTAINPLPTPSISGVTAFCAGSSTTLDAGSYAGFIWSTGETTQTVSVTTAGTFTVTVTDGNGCSGNTSVTTAINPLPTPSISGVTAFCAGSSTTLDAGSYAGFIWSTGETTQTVSVTTAGTFTVTVTDGNGCSGSTSVATTINTLPTPSISGATAFCAGSSTTLDVGTFAGYNWSTGETTQTVSVTTAGTFTVTVTDGNGCSGSTSVATTINTLPTPSISGATAFCAGSSTTLDVGTFAGYNWSTGETTQTVSVTTAGTFTVTVTDGNGCSGNTSVTTTINTLPTPSISGVTAFCAGGSTTLDVGTFAGYNWSTGETTQTVSVTTAGTFMVTVTDGNGCSGNTSAITTVHPIDTKISITDQISCNGFCDGSLRLTNFVGTAPFNYLWSNGETTKLISNLCSSTYTATVTDTYGCSITLSRKLTQPGVLKPNGVKTEITTVNDGAMTFNPTGGTSPYNYLWSDGYAASSRINIAPGKYTITISDANGCNKTITLRWKAVSSRTGVELPGNFEIAVYPNPASSSATLQFDAMTEGNGVLTVYDIVGQQVLSKPMNVLSGDNQFALDLNAFPKGIYNVRVDYNGMVRNQKLVVQ